MEDISIGARVVFYTLWCVVKQQRTDDIFSSAHLDNEANYKRMNRALTKLRKNHAFIDPFIVYGIDKEKVLEQVEKLISEFYL